MERLDKFLCDSGVGTRSQVKAILKSGRVTVDGKPVEVYETLDALLAFDVSEGQHSIEMIYRPEIYKTAVLLCAAGTLSLGAIIAAEFIYRYFKNKKANSLLESENN